jgi:hypothetical protein
MLIATNIDVNIANKMYIGGIEKKPLMVPLM